MSKHTQGPWYAVQPPEANGWWIVSTDPEGYDCVDDSHDGGFTEERARLIAAAPRMLSVVERGAAAGDAKCIEILEAINGNA